MALKRKISVRKILQVMLTLVVTSGCVVAMVGASRIEDRKVVKGMAVHIKNDKKYHFIEEQEIADLAINNRNVDLQHTPASRLDLHGMEQTIRQDPWVASAQVYIDNTGMLQMYVTQRVPVVRVFQQNTASYYMDTTMSIMPLSDNYKYYTTVVTNVPELKNDSVSWLMKKNIVTMARAIQADTFWNAQVAEVVFDSAGGFQLLPVLGDQVILFGQATDIRDKFDNLFTFYKKVLNRIGWDKYQTLDIRFGGQVVASPSLPYTGPVDKAVTNMNWINSIVQTEAAKDAVDSVKKEQPKQMAKPKPQATVATLKKKPLMLKARTKDKDKKAKENKKKSPKYIYKKKDH
jgi:cell division protein FtsQ